MHDSETTQGVVTFRQVGHVLQRGWAILLTCMILGIALTGLLFNAVPASYTSTSAVSLSPGVVTLSASPKDISTATETAIADSSAVADRAAPLLKWHGSTANLLDHLNVTSPRDSQVLQLSYTDATPSAAAAGANAFATAYLAYRTDTAQAGLQARLDRTGERIAELQKASDALAPIIADRKSTQAKVSAAKTAQLLLARQINMLQDQQAAVATTTVNAGHVVNRGFPPLTSDHSAKIFLLAGLLFGLVVGVTIAMLRNLGDTTVRDTRSIEDGFTVPVLESVPEQMSSPDEPNAFGVLDSVGGPEADAYRSLAAKMTVGATPSSRRVLLVAAGDLQTANTPVSLAVTLAEQGQRVLLLGSPDCMANACLLVRPDYAVPKHAAGVQELLRTQGLRVVSFGDELSLVATLHSQGADELALMLAEVDILIIDGINVQLASTPLNLAKLADEALVVVRQGETHIPEIGTTLHGLRQVALPVEGVVFLVPERRRRFTGDERGARPTQSTRLDESVSVRSARSRS